jgi:hypothetical protein
MIRRLLQWITARISPPRVIYDRLGVSPYLSRHYIVGRPKMPDGSAPFDWDGAPRSGIVWPSSSLGICLHHFHRSDEAGELHNHPWRWAISFILAGGYREERRLRGTNRVIQRTVKPGSLNFIGAEDFHRIDLLQPDAWSLFIVGPRFSDWGFWNRETTRFTPWRQFINGHLAPSVWARVS